jgi:hypothetical protein
MTEKSPSAPSDEPVHVFDQTNDVLRDDPHPEHRGKRAGAKGDLPGATHLALGGF